MHHVCENEMKIIKAKPRKHSKFNMEKASRLAIERTSSEIVSFKKNLLNHQ